MNGKEKQDEKRPNTWEMADPKPPVIHSSHRSNRRVH